MTRLAFALVALGGFLAGAVTMLLALDRLIGPYTIRIGDPEFAEPWGDV